MPDCDRKMWVYNSNKMFHLRPEIDQLTIDYIQKYHGKEFKELQLMLRVQDVKYQEAYGGIKKGKFEETKMKDLYTRMGNCILTEMRRYDRSLRELPQVQENKERSENVRKNWILSSALWNLKRSLKSEYEKRMNEREHDRLVEEEDR